MNKTPSVPKPGKDSKPKNPFNEMLDKMQTRMRNENIKFTLRLIFSCALIYLLYKSVDPVKLKSILYTVDYRYLFAGIIAFSIAVVVSAAAWKILLNALNLDISWPHVIKFRLISFFMNNALPSGIAGDAWRAYVVGMEKRNPGASFASVLVEKWVSYVSLALFSLLSLILGWKQFQDSTIFKPVLYFVCFMMGTVILSIILLPWFIDKGKSFFLKYGIDNPYLIGMESLHKYREKKHAVLYSLLITCLSPLVGVFAYYFIALSLGCKVPLFSFFVLVPLIRVINHIPVSVNSIGTQDITMVIFFAGFGITKELGFAMSLLGHLLKVVVGAAGGILYMGFFSKKTKKKS